MELVAGVEENDVIALGLRDGFVHGIVEPLVGFADEAYGVGMMSVAVALDIPLNLAHGPVLRTAVHDEMLHSLVGLGGYAVEGPCDGGLGVEGDGGDGELDHDLRLYEFTFLRGLPKVQGSQRLTI